MFVPGQHYISDALQAHSSSAYSSSTDEGVNSPKHCVLSREWCFLSGLPSRRFDGLLVFSGGQS